MPTAVMPMASQVWRVVGNHNHVESTFGYRLVAARADVRLEGGVWLNRADRHPEKIAHSTRAIAEPIAATTMMMSTTVRSCSRNGLKPIV